MSSLLDIHRALLDQWRGAMNLVGPGEASFHYEDANRALDLLDTPAASEQVRGRWADLGTGAGFPGIVLAARFPDLSLELVDSRKKRCTFLEHVLRSAGIPEDRVAVRCTRIEDLPDAAYDGITARALAPPPRVLAYAHRLLRPGGVVLLLIGGRDEVPADPHFEALAERTYTVAERLHRAVLLRRV